MLLKKKMKIQINETIKAPVHETTQNFKDQEKIITENCGLNVQLKKLNDNALIATFDAEHMGQKEFQLNNEQQVLLICLAHLFKPETHSSFQNP